MSNKVSSLVRSRVVGSAALKAVLLNMADKADDDGADVFASKATIAAETELDRATVFRAIDKLLTLGLLEKDGERPCRNGFTVNYRLRVEAIENLPSWRGDQSQAATPPVAQCDPYQSQAATPPVAQCDPYQSQAATPTSRTVRPKPPLEPSLEPSNDNDDEGDGDARPRACEILGGWTSDTLFDAVVTAAEANPGHINWRNPAQRETVWGWLGEYGISAEELLSIIRGSRRGHRGEHPNSPNAFIEDIRTFVAIRKRNVTDSGQADVEVMRPSKTAARRRAMAPTGTSIASIVARRRFAEMQVKQHEDKP